jgi:AraC-like DNA-binding protein
MAADGVATRLSLSINRAVSASSASPPFLVSEAAAPDLSSQEDHDDEFLRQVHALINQQIANPALSVEFLAQELGMSRTLLFNKLKSITGQSAKALISTSKMDHAIALLRSGQYQVGEVAHLVGYSNHSYFARAFKRQVGEPPSAFLPQ